MRRPRVHFHDCVSCQQQYACDGELEGNTDGWPEVICVEFHERWCRTCDECRERHALAANADALENI